MRHGGGGRARASLRGASGGAGHEGGGGGARGSPVSSSVPRCHPVSGGTAGARQERGSRERLGGAAARAGGSARGKPEQGPGVCPGGTGWNRPAPVTAVRNGLGRCLQTLGAEPVSGWGGARASGGRSCGSLSLVTQRLGCQQWLRTARGSLHSCLLNSLFFSPSDSDLVCSFLLLFPHGVCEGVSQLPHEWEKGVFFDLGQISSKL